jgi:hypothetical protein
VGFPTLLTAPDALAPEARAALTSLGVAAGRRARRRAVVSPAVVAQVEAMGIRVVRLAGANRSETAALVAAFAVERLGFEQAT